MSPGPAPTSTAAATPTPTASTTPIAWDTLPEAIWMRAELDALRTRYHNVLGEDVVKTAMRKIQFAYDHPQLKNNRPLDPWAAAQEAFNTQERALKEDLEKAEKKLKETSSTTEETLFNNFIAALGQANPAAVVDLQEADKQDSNLYSAKQEIILLIQTLQKAGKEKPIKPELKAKILPFLKTYQAAIDKLPKATHGSVNTTDPNLSWNEADRTAFNQLLIRIAADEDVQVAHRGQEAFEHAAGFLAATQVLTGIIPKETRKAMKENDFGPIAKILDTVDGLIGGLERAQDAADKLHKGKILREPIHVREACDKVVVKVFDRQARSDFLNGLMKEVGIVVGPNMVQKATEIKSFVEEHMKTLPLIGGVMTARSHQQSNNNTAVGPVNNNQSRQNNSPADLVNLASNRMSGARTL